MSIFKKTDLENGIRIVSEFHPQSRSVSMGAWILSGSRDEGPEEKGLAHFLEHLVFKRTKTRTAYQIAKSLESLGGDLNAYTSKENTCFHALVLKDHWPKAMEILSDLVTNMAIEKEEFKVEKGVILQEIAMSEENHEDFVYELFFEKIYGKNPLANPILGTIKSIAQMTQKEVYHFYKSHYVGNNIVISAAGNIDHQELVEEVQKYLGHKKKIRLQNKRKVPHWKRTRFIVERPSEQVHLVMGVPSSGFKDRQRFEAYIVNALLGGGMTSRLYQSVREKRGLAYSVHSSLNSHMDSGMMLIYAGADTTKIKKVVHLITQELKKIKRIKIKDSEVDLYKTQVVGNILLGSDDMENRMTSIAVNEIVFGKYKSVDSVIAEINKVTAQTVNEYIRERLNLDQISGVMLGADLGSLQSWWEEA